jgi:hypothetical protein
MKRTYTKYPSNYVKASKLSDARQWYFGKDEKELCGDAIQELCTGWIISKRIADEEKPFSLASVAELLKSTYPDRFSDTYTLHFGQESEEQDFDMYTILGALEGMCHDNQACEVADGFYYVGSYADWRNDNEAKAQLADLENS